MERLAKKNFYIELERLILERKNCLKQIEKFALRARTNEKLLTAHPCIPHIGGH